MTISSNTEDPSRTESCSRYLGVRIANFIQGVLKLWGNSSVKRLVWDREFSSGRWDYIDRTSDDVIYHYLEKYCNSGSILDLGCGSGNTGNELDIMKYRRYTGIDISKDAIQKAILRTEKNHRDAKNEYFAADISKYVPEKNYDIILFRESIHYIRKTNIKGMLNRYSNYLGGNGVFIVRMYDREKYGSIVRTIEDNHRVIERYLSDGSMAIVIIFRPK